MEVERRARAGAPEGDPVVHAVVGERRGSVAAEHTRAQWWWWWWWRGRAHGMACFVVAVGVVVVVVVGVVVVVVVVAVVVVVVGGGSGGVGSGGFRATAEAMLHEGWRRLTDNDG